MNPNLANDRIGVYGKNKYGSLMKVIKYIDNKNIIVQFDDGYTVPTNWDAFVKGKVRNPYDRSINGIGYIGEGNYQPSVMDKQIPQYTTWINMLKRCYCGKFHDNYPTYKDCSVCDEWLNFQNFAEWYDSNYYEIEGEKMQLDKDILIKGNKVYNPETCIFVPERINKLFVKRDSSRGDLPIGVALDKRNGIYVIHQLKNSINYNPKTTNTPEKAFLFYKENKEKYIQEMAEKYKDKIPNKLYEAMINYQVEITD